MIHSMTAFARQETHHSSGNIVCEIRSVNHRYLEINIRLPETWNALESLVRECIKEKITRGRIDVFLRYEPTHNTTPELVLNKPLARQLIKTYKEIAALDEFCNAELNPTDILQWPGLLKTAEINFDQIKSAMLDLLKKCLDDLVSARAKEGKALSVFLQQRLHHAHQELTKIKKHLPEILTEQRKKLLTRVAEVHELDPTRLEQEIVLFAQKIDVSEELDRLATHLTEFDANLKQRAANGRRLDFLLQEMNREANTLGSKSVNTVTTMASVELKVLIEQMREQAQNIE